MTLLEQMQTEILRGLDAAAKLLAAAHDVPACGGHGFTVGCEIGPLHEGVALIARQLAELMADPTNTLIVHRHHGELRKSVEQLTIALLLFHRTVRQRGDNQARRNSVLAYLRAQGPCTATELGMWLNLTREQVGDAVEHWVKLGKIEVRDRLYEATA